jgi:cytochrome d ubiquinol oxidase subunit II
LIFLIVLLFTAFPAAFGALSIAFFVPFHLVLVGIVLRGAAFVFRAHGAAAGLAGPWGSVFGAASVFTPFLLGACLGAISAGQVRVDGERVLADPLATWLAPFALGCGALALALCAYLAAIYLTMETSGPVRDDFRRRALATWWVAGAISVGLLPLAALEAPRLWQGLIGPLAGPVVALGALLAPLSGLAIWRGHYRLGRLAAAAQVALLLTGWGLAQLPYIIYPDVTLQAAAAPAATLQFFLQTLPFGLALIAPSLWLLFSVFKHRNEVVPTQGHGSD